MRRDTAFARFGEQVEALRCAWLDLEHGGGGDIAMGRVRFITAASVFMSARQIAAVLQSEPLLSVSHVTVATTLNNLESAEVAG
mgnify:CR=1 FL=1